MGLKFKYTGDGGWLPGVPARDLTDADVRDLDRDARALLEEHLQLEEGRIYDVADAPKPARKSGSEEE